MNVPAGRFFPTLALLCAGGLLVTGCLAEDEASDEVTEPVAEQGATTPGPGLPQTTIELGRFEGRYVAATGEFVIENLPLELPEGTLPADGMRSVPQASWCPVRVDGGDGDPNVNPPNTFQVYSVARPDASLSTFVTSDCVADAVAYLAARGLSPAEVADRTADFFLDGTFCSNINVRSFFPPTTTHTDVVAEITTFAGQAAEAPYPYPLGTSLAVPGEAGANNVDQAVGYWLYGTLDGGESATVPWVFRYGGNDFSFSGRIVAHVQENCSNSLDDDCDGVVNDECGTVAAGGACTTDADCATRHCAGAVCQANCRDGVFGPGCTSTCPGGEGLAQCSGSGTCNDGLAGTGACTCNAGYGGADCAACLDGRFGASCASVCPGGAGAAQCSGRGTCSDGEAGTGLCTCPTGFGGVACSGCLNGRWGATCAECPGGASNPCNGNGVCSEGLAGTGACTCDAGWTGADCSTAVPTSPPVPTGVAATDGTRTDGVNVTWNPSPGATSYEIYRDGVLVGTFTGSGAAGEVASARNHMTSGSHRQPRFPWCCG